MHKKITLLIPTVLVALMMILLMMALHNKEMSAPTVMQEKPFPLFQLPALHAAQPLTESLFTIPNKTGYRLLNVWASWCVVCKTEHPYLLTLAAQGIDIIGLNYRDKHQSAKLLLDNMGNPYQQIIVDQQGQLALNLGVVGTPESYLVNNQGMIIARFNGVLTEQIWTTQFAPHLPQHKD